MKFRLIYLEFNKIFKATQFGANDPLNRNNIMEVCLIYSGIISYYYFFIKCL